MSRAEPLVMPWGRPDQRRMTRWLAREAEPGLAARRVVPSSPASSIVGVPADRASAVARAAQAIDAAPTALGQTHRAASTSSEWRSLPARGSALTQTGPPQASQTGQVQADMPTDPAADLEARLLPRLLAATVRRVDARLADLLR